VALSIALRLATIQFIPRTRFFPNRQKHRNTCEMLKGISILQFQFQGNIRIVDKIQLKFAV